MTEATNIVIPYPRKPLPPREVLSARFSIGSKGNYLRYNVLPSGYFGDSLKDEARLILFNDRNAGHPLSFTDVDGYKKVSIDGEVYFVHRILHKMRTGREPLFLDHINGDTRNSKASNLREVTPLQNAQNRALGANNKSGFFGVRQLPSGNWLAIIGHLGKSLYLGTFETKQEAVDARKIAERELGFHPNHGRQRKLSKADFKGDRNSPYVLSRQRRNGTRRKGLTPKPSRFS